MKGLICITTATVLASLFILATPRAQSVDEFVAQAVTPLPEDLRAGATVLTYDLASRKRKVLRQGTNDLECRPRDPETLFTFCAHKATGPTWDLQAKLRAEGKSAEEIQAGTSRPHAFPLHRSQADAGDHASGDRVAIIPGVCPGL